MGHTNPDVAEPTAEPVEPVGDTEPPAVLTGTVRPHDTSSSASDAPQLLFFDEITTEDGMFEQSSQSVTPSATVTEEEDLSDLPELAPDSDSEESEDDPQHDVLPQPHRRSYTPAVSEIQVWAECPPQNEDPYPRTDESFPDDDAWADNRDLSFASMIDRTHLTDQQFLEALQLLEDNKDVFCFHPSELGTCTVGSHTIDTSEAAPIKKAYRIQDAFQEV
jgi:hypothetical protein